MTPFDADVVVIGAGAAGLVAAIHAAEHGRRVLLLEKNRKPGVKILMSGGTRCNITHACDHRGIIEAFGPNGKFLHSALAAFGVQDTLAFFHAEGVATKVEETGKIFPVSDRALDVLNALLGRLRRSTAVLSLGEAVADLRPRSDGSFQIVTSTRSLTAEKVIVTTGGRSYPGCGTTGDGYGWAERLGHTIIPQRPALVPLTVNVPWVPELRGLTLPDVGLKVIEQKPLATRRGSLLFAHFGLSGPVALDVSRAVSGHPEPTKLRLECDLLPGQTEQQFDELLRQESAANGKKLVVNVLADLLPRRMADQVLSLANVPADRKGATLSKPERAAVVANVKRLTMPLRGTLGFEKAEVTAGGVALDEVDSRNLQSKKVPGLHFAGEILDLDGWIGGYNFQSAWSTGWLAGRSV